MKNVVTVEKCYDLFAVLRVTTERKERNRLQNVIKP
jgi:hypothetical protein